jgi:predicted transposase/invertase (TIGR01784 family)
MAKVQKLIRFDWAIKNILRNKANFDVLEGFLSALLTDEIEVLELLDTESNQDAETLKYNRVDILVKDSNNRHLIIEVQNERESDYLQRLLFGTSKVIIDHHELGQPYQEITKVISVSILYFNLGAGDDYVYYGSTIFRGLHTQQPLKLRKREQVKEQFFLKDVDIEREIFPEYYLIQVERFEDNIQSPLDEWIYMLKHEQVRDDFQSRHIDRARDKLSLLTMNDEQRQQYERYLMNVASERDIMQTAHSEGEKIGFEKGREAERADMVLRLHNKGKSIAEIADLTDLPLEVVQIIVH